MSTNDLYAAMVLDNEDIRPDQTEDAEDIEEAVGNDDDEEDDEFENNFPAISGHGNSVSTDSMSLDQVIKMLH